MLQIGKTLHGFRLIEQKEIVEINSIARLFEHIQSGARLLHLENDDDNKVFSIAFKTPPHDSTGIPHILEHSVLCGSRKFPTKEPFIELMKGSMNSFLNAFTSSDKTIYPVASKNDKDFVNLMNVYLDAVLFPKIYDIPEIFMQEGWHYELDDRDGELTYKGVVYNEMKGAFSSPESVLGRKIQETLFPDTSYGFESGGDPDVIPDLRYQQFTAFHKKYYHPANSYIFLYGNGKLEEHLKFINSEYLRHFDRIEIDSSIREQKPFAAPREVVVEYPISPNEVENDKTYLALNFVVGHSSDPLIHLAFGILKHLLLDTPAAPLKKAMIDAGIGKDVYGKFDNIMQPTFSIIVKKSSLELKEKFKDVVFECLQDIVKNGINEKQLEASINIHEFLLREADFGDWPKGVLYSFNSLVNWLHGGDPTLLLQYERTLKEIKSKTASSRQVKTPDATVGFFEGLIEKQLLNNNHRSLLILKPQKGLVEEKEKETKKKLADYKASLSERELDEIIKQTQTLKLRQQTPDTPEILETIPMLSLKDINPQAEKLPLVEKEIDGVKVLTHPMFTNNIGYLNLYFNTTCVPQKLIQYIPLLARVLGKVDTTNYSYGELSNEINIHTGGIGCSTGIFPEKDTDEKYHPMFKVESKVLMNKLPVLLELIKETLVNSKLNNRKRIKEIIQETKSRLEMGLSFHGHLFAIKRAFSYFSQSGKYTDLINGLSFYKFIAGLENNFSMKESEIIANLSKIAEFIFNRNNLLVSFTSAEDGYSKLKNDFGILLDDLNVSKLEKIDYNFDLSRDNEGLMTPGKVQYVAKAYNYRRSGKQYNGVMQILRKVIQRDYLWNRIRVQGGAYGAFMGFARDGSLYMGSFRDPNLVETLETFDQAEEYIRNFETSSREMTKYIIGTISDFDKPLTPSMKGEFATANYISHISQNDIQKERDDVLNATPEEIQQFADVVGEAMKHNYFSVLGNEGKITDNKNVFGKLVNVFE
ncbi:MAG: insulinase family protein [Candidatus Hatepunaea meridiana]|nr:insulinase family protein [Candidatus Hatepunaea meridiana]